MLTTIRFQNFKSWRDTGDIRFAPLTGFFGTNSSGKTAILHFLLMLKQTVESSNQKQTLELEKPYTHLGTFYDIIHQHQLSEVLTLALGWRLLEFPIITELDQMIIYNVLFNARIAGSEDDISLESFSYTFGTNEQSYLFGMDQETNLPHKHILETSAFKYRFLNKGHTFKHPDISRTFFSDPIKFYGFPYGLYAFEPETRFMSELPYLFESLFQRISYLGPLREHPQRIYIANNTVGAIGNRGENAIQLLLAVRKLRSGIVTRVARWLREIGLIHSFRLHRIAPRRSEYEVRVKLKEHSPEVLLTEVGFGVSQILPVLVLCASAAAGSILIFEQPEIHLHPAVQAGLADVFIETITKRKVQIVLESHSEHLLRRLQRRIAEEQLDNADAALYFCATDNTGTSHLTTLAIDDYGNINNWPENFFGDELGDLAAMTIAAMERQQREAE